MPNLQLLAKQCIFKLRKQCEEHASDQAYSVIEKLSYALENDTISTADPLINAFQQARDEFVSMQLKPLQATCQAFLNEASHLINVEYNSQHAFAGMPLDIFSLILIPEPINIDFSMLLLLAQVSQKFYSAVYSILKTHHPKVDYTSSSTPPLKITFTDEVVYNYKSLPHRDWLIVKDLIDSNFYAKSLKNETYRSKIDIEKNAKIIASTPTGNTILITTLEGFDIVDLPSNQRFSCKNTIFLNAYSTFENLISAKYLMLLPDKKTLVRLDQLDFIYLTDLSFASPNIRIDPFSLSSDFEPVATYIKGISITPDGQYLIVVHGHFSEGLSMWRLDTKKLHQRLIPPDGATKEKYAFLQKFSISHNSRSVALVHESEKNWLGKSTLFCLQWQISENSIQKATEITLSNVERDTHLEKLTYIPNGSCLVGLLNHSGKNGVEIKIWNARNGQCLHQQFFSDFNLKATDLIINAMGEVILMSEKQNHLTKLKFTHLKPNPNVLEKISKKTLKNKDSLSEHLVIILLLGMSISLASILFTTLILQSIAFILTTGAIFLVLGLLMGTAIVFLPRMMNQDCADLTDQKINDHATTQQVENNPTNSCDPLAIKSEYFGAVFKPKSEKAINAQVAPPTSSSKEIYRSSPQYRHISPYES